jgi:preprotein translocase subunit YajC
MQQYSTFLLIALMVVAFYFLIMRPQKKRQQAMQKTINESVPGTRVMLGSGVFGTIVAVGDRQIILEIAPGVELTVLKQAIARVVTDEDEDTEFTVEDDGLEDEVTTEPEPEPLTDTEPPVTGTDQKPTTAG